MNKKQLGYFGENLAANFLLENNYQILHRNFRCFLGEIDIISKKENLLIFVEVKTRMSTVFGMAKEAVAWQKQRKLSKLAEFYLQNYHGNCKLLQPRFDVIEVYLLKDNEKNYHIVHLEGAF
ncbi:MAG: YraN family protein [Clostridia bacterium]|nr:YraN family protein [Clostridia bacterium]